MVRVLAIAALALSLGCGIEPRSNDYRCVEGACGDGRVCVDGWCVVDPDLIDAPPGGPDAPIDAFVCPAVCTSCVNRVCVIDCDNDNSCGDPVMCPPGVDCEVNCNGDGSCRRGVFCGNATDCNVDCDGAGSCGDGVTCGAAACDVTCAGTGSCADGVQCGSSCACDTSCAVNACTGGVSCPGPATCQQNGECTSNPGPCDSC